MVSKTSPWTTQWWKVNRIIVLTQYHYTSVNLTDGHTDRYTCTDRPLCHIADCDRNQPVMHTAAVCCFLLQLSGWGRIRRNMSRKKVLFQRLTCSELDCSKKVVTSASVTRIAPPKVSIFITRSALGRAHLPPTTVFRRLKTTRCCIDGRPIPVRGIFPT